MFGRHTQPECALYNGGRGATYNHPIRDPVRMHSEGGGAALDKASAFSCNILSTCLLKTELPLLSLPVLDRKPRRRREIAESAWNPATGVLASRAAARSLFKEAKRFAKTTASATSWGSSSGRASTRARSCAGRPKWRRSPRSASWMASSGPCDQFLFCFDILASPFIASGASYGGWSEPTRAKRARGCESERPCT